MKMLWMTVTILVACSASAEQIDPARIRLIDGDTIRIDGAKPDHRLSGFNAPDLRREENEAEREDGRRVFTPPSTVRYDRDGRYRDAKGQRAFDAVAANDAVNVREATVQLLTGKSRDRLTEEI